jgi:uncharacterized membrane protein
VFEIQKTLHVRAPVEAVFHYFSDFQTFPRFMAHVRSVEMIDQQRSRWVVEGPFGVPLGWESEIVALEPNRRIAWRTVKATPIESSGEVRFAPDGEGTRMQIRINYRSPLGVIGRLIAELFGHDPKRQIDGDLLRFKSLMEEGKARGRGHQVTRQELEAERPQFL